MYYTFGYIKPDKIYLIINNELSSSTVNSLPIAWAWEHRCQRTYGKFCRENALLPAKALILSGQARINIYTP